jgi:hypothetical protein
MIPLPTPDPLGYPLPTPLLQGLAYLTLTLHLLAMSFTLGSLALLLWSKLRRAPGHDAAARFLGSSLPLGFSYLVTLGIPPLLFLQVVYGQLFYSSSVLIGAFWILVIPLLITAYGLLYLHKMTRETRPRLQGIALLAAFAAMLSIGFIYVNNLTLSMAPERWMAHYAAHPDGAALNLGEPTLAPRFLAFMLPSLAVAGLGLVLAGAVVARLGRAEAGQGMRRYGARAHVVGRVLMAGAGAWLLAALPERVRAYVLGGGLPTLLLAAGLGLALVATAAALLAARRGSTALAVAAAVAMALELGSLVALRDGVRLELLAERFRLAEVPIDAQWGMFVAFAAILVVGLAFLVGMTRIVVKNAVAKEIGG